MPTDLLANSPAGHEPEPFVGRTSELLLLQGLWRKVLAGRPGVALVEGPGGIGKSALVDAFLGVIPEKCLLRSSGEEAEARLTYGVLSQLLADAPTRQPEFAATIRSDERPTHPLTAGAAFVNLMGQLQDPNPVLLVVDDLHWADAPSLQALTFALRRLRADRVLALLVTRDVLEAPLPGGMRRLLGGKDVLRLSLAGLTADQLQELGSQMRASPLSVRAAVRLQTHTEGNPLHARALLAQLSPSAINDLAVPLPAPRSFSLLVLGQLAHCRMGTQELVAAASVLGMRCPFHLASALAESEDPLPALEEAIAAGLLVEETNTRTIRFAHPLIHAAVAHQLSVTRRTALHARAAALVQDEQTQLQHRAAAASGPDAGLAFDLAEFGRHRANGGDWAGAGGHLATAAWLSPDRAGFEQLSLEAFEAKLQAGDPVNADMLATQVRGFAAGGWRSYILGRLAFVAGHLAEAEALLEDAWSRCDPDTDTALAVRIAVHLAMLCVIGDRGRETVKWADLVIGLRSENSGQDLLRYVRLNGLGLIGQSDAALSSLSNLPEASLASVADLDLVLARGRLRIWTDDLANAHSDLVALLGVAHERSVEFQLMVNGMLVETEYRLGRWDEAAAHGGVAVSIAIDAEHASLAPFCHATAALVPAARGEWEQATAHVVAARATVHDPGNLAGLAFTANAEAYIATARGDPYGVLEALRPLLALRHSDGAHEPGILHWKDQLVEALVVLRRFDQAEAVLASLEDLASARQRYSSLAAAARARGNLAAARGDAASAAQAFQAGLDYASRVDMPFERALLDLAYGQFLRRMGKRAVAASTLESARGVFQELGAHPYLQRCARELAACGGSATPARIPDPNRLTPQELAVAGLVVRGLTNQQVARELVLSIKTIEYHLGHVYAKLGVRSRGQLACRFNKPQGNP